MLFSDPVKSLSIPFLKVYIILTGSDPDRILEQGISQGISQGVVEGIVKMCKRYNGTIQEAIDQVMEELDYNEEAATKEVKKYW